MCLFFFSKGAAMHSRLRVFCSALGKLAEPFNSPDVSVSSENQVETYLEKYRLISAILG